MYRKNHFLKIFFLFVIFSCLRTLSIGQSSLVVPKSTNSTSWFVDYSTTHGINYNYFILSQKNSDFLNKNFWEFNLKIGRQTNGQRRWHQLFNQPYQGVGLSFTNISHNKTIGNPLSLFYHFSVPLKAKGLIKLNATLNSGIAYFFNNKKLFINPENNIVGSRFNFFINPEFSLAYSMSNQWQSHFGIQFIHYSNGGIKAPNLGINLLGASLGLRYFLRPVSSAKKQIKPMLSSTKVKYQASISLKAAMNKYRDNKSPVYYSIVSGDLWRSKNEISALGVGTDIFQIFDTNRIKEQKKIFAGLRVGHKLSTSNVAFLTQVGILLIKRKEDAPIFYTKIGCEIRVTSRLYATILLKSDHALTADFVEWGSTYYF